MYDDAKGPLECVGLSFLDIIILGNVDLIKKKKKKRQKEDKGFKVDQSQSTPSILY